MADFIMTKTKRFSRIITFALAILMVVAMAVPTFAADQTHKIQLRDSASDATIMRLDGVGHVMNAYATSTAQTNTKLSIYAYTGHDTQKFYTNNSRLFNKTNPNVCAGIELSTSMAKFLPVSTPASQIRIQGVTAGKLNYFRFHLPDYNRYLGAFGTNSGAYLYFVNTGDSSAHTVWNYATY